MISTSGESTSGGPPPVRLLHHQSLLEPEILIRLVRPEPLRDYPSTSAEAASFSRLALTPRLASASFQGNRFGSLPSATFKLRTSAMRGMCAPVVPELLLPPTPLQYRVRDFSSLGPVGLNLRLTQLSTYSFKI